MLLWSLGTRDVHRKNYLNFIQKVFLISLRAVNSFFFSYHLMTDMAKLAFWNSNKKKLDSELSYSKSINPTFVAVLQLLLTDSFSVSTILRNLLNGKLCQLAAIAVGRVSFTYWEGPSDHPPWRVFPQNQANVGMELTIRPGLISSL